MGSFFDKTDAVFVAESPKISGKGEDSFCYCINSDAVLTGVFDGCGGSGSRLCSGFDKHTEAYVASRISSGVVYDWFKSGGYRACSSDTDLLKSVDKVIREGMEYAEANNTRNSRIKSSMVIGFPSTMAAAIIRPSGLYVEVNAIWVGDSRIYILDSDGLAQFSEDGSDDTDAFDSLISGGGMTNCLSSDGDFEICNKKIILKKPSIVLAATDGCFGYYLSPMEFEYMILNAISEASNIEGCIENLNNSISEVTGDDFSMVAAAFGYGSFDSIKDSMAARIKYLKKSVISKIKNDDIDVRRTYWNNYKSGYERLL